MNETTRLEKVKRALQDAVIHTCDAEFCLEEAASLCDPVSVKAGEIRALKSRLDRLGTEILELSKT